MENNISSCFSLQFPVDISSNDGVLLEYDYDEINEIITSIRQSYSVVDLICFDEGNVALASSLRKGKKSAKNLERFRYKVVMKKWLQTRSVPTPLFLDTLSEHHEANEISTQLGMPFVVKPKKSPGSNNIHIIRNEKDFLKIKKIGSETLRCYEAEEYIDGDLYHCD
ncbi:hypothetical protein [Marinomonas sp. 2405UD68-3]|uniref:hypothetical protein n=1 Tax=Marinomonas sp. 2405UD68-3 TaxID=3391835 RepID=UPI0039C9DC93